MDLTTNNMDNSTKSSGEIHKSLPERVVYQVPQFNEATRLLSPWLRIAHSRRLWDSPNIVPLRRIRDFELLLVLEGECWLWVEPAGGALKLQSGMAALIPPDIVHTWGESIGSHLAVHFDLCAQPDLVPLDNLVVLSKQVVYKPAGVIPLIQWDAWKGQRAPLIRRLSDPAPWQERLEKLVSLSAGRTSAELNLDEQSQVATHLLWLFRAWMAFDSVAGSAEDDPVQRVRALLGQIDPTDRNSSIEDLAGRCHISATGFRIIFHNLTGRSPRQWLENRRMDLAAHRLLHTNMAVAVIAGEVGYDDSFHFSRVFKRVMGLSPRAYRTKQRKNV